MLTEKLRMKVLTTKFKLTDRGAKKAKAKWFPFMGNVEEEEIMRFLSGRVKFGMTGKELVKKDKSDEHGYGYGERYILTGLRSLINRGLVESVSKIKDIEAEEATPTFTTDIKRERLAHRRRASVSQRTPRITPKVGRLK